MMRALILDFDFFTSAGGGQTFYRRMVERHPDIQFSYPSRGPDLRLKDGPHLPPNAMPFAFDERIDLGGVEVAQLGPEAHWVEIHQVRLLHRVALALQGCSFDVAEIPSFLPVAHLLRDVFAAYGIGVGQVSLGLLGWVSTSLRKGTKAEDVIAALERLEQRSVAAADLLYTISELHAGENRPLGRSISMIDMHDALEEVPSPLQLPEGEGPPDLCYVGRLDRAKGPDLFLEIAARIPRQLFRECLLIGPDDTWSPEGSRWSDSLLAQAAELGLEVRYLGRLPDEALRARIYRGRSVLVVPSRTDAFNLVALEALQHGCPLLLSRNTGAAGFLQARHPRLVPPIIDPEAIGDAAATLTDLLSNYDGRVRALRRALTEYPLPRPRQGFMASLFTPQATPGAPLGIPPVPPRTGPHPLCRPSAVGWRPEIPVAPEAEVSAIIVARGAPERLAMTLATLARQTRPLRQVIVVDDGSPDAAIIRGIVAGFGPGIRLIRQGPRGLPISAIQGLHAADGEVICLATAGARFAGDAIEALAGEATGSGENAAPTDRGICALAARHGVMEEAASVFGAVMPAMPAGTRILDNSLVWSPADALAAWDI